MKNQINGEEAVKFLFEEFNQCLSHMRHYDNLKLSLAKFAFSFYSAVAAVSFSLERYFYYELKTESVHLFLSLLLFLTFLLGLVILVMQARYRKYFVLVARQVNSIRRYFLQTVKAGMIDFENLLQTDPKKPTALNVKSTYLLLAFLFSLINAIALGFAGFFILSYLEFCAKYLYSVPTILFVVSLFSEGYYLKRELREV